MLSMCRDGDSDSPYLLQLMPPDDQDYKNGELAVHTVVADAGLEIDRHRHTAQWTANDYALSENAERAVFHVRFSNLQGLSEFEKVFRAGMAAAEESETYLSTTNS